MLHTEMVVAAALVRGGAHHLLRHDQGEHPVVLQLGGSDPAELAEAARLGAEVGFDGVDLNVGCPSDRVQSGCFGAVLMRDPALVARCVAAMVAAQPRPVTVKCRIGVDEQDPEVVLPDFLSRVRDAGAARVTVHARKAWLQGLSPKENREIPPLDHALVVRMAARFSDLPIAINGGIGSLAEARALLDQGLAGVMIGRAAYTMPTEILLGADHAIWGDPPSDRSPQDVARAMLPHIAAHVAEGGRVGDVTRHMLGLFGGRPGARAWRRHLSEAAHRPGAGPEVVLEALELVPPLAEAA